MIHCFFSLAFIIFLLPGCGVSVKKDWQSLQSNARERTGYHIPFESFIPLSSQDLDFLSKTEAIERALMSNPKLHAYFQELGIAKSDLIQAGLYKNPDFTTSINIPKNNLDTNEVDIGFVLSLSEAWQLPVRKRVASYNLEVISLLIINTILSTIAEVEHAYLSCDYFQNLLTLHQDMWEQAQLLTEQLIYRQQFGMQSDLDIFLAQAFQEESYTKILETQNSLSIAYSKLRELMGEKPTLEALAIKSIIHSELWDYSYDDLYCLALQRPDIEAAEYRIKQFGKLIELERRKVVESMSIGVSWAKDFERAKGTGPIFAIELPLFNLNQAQIARAQFNKTQAEQNFHAKQLEVTHHLNSAFSTYTTSQKKLVPLHQAVNRNQQAVAYTYRFFRSMQIKLPLLIETRLSLLGSQQMLLKAYYDTYGAYIDLQKIIGRRLSQQEPLSIANEAQPS